MALELQPLVCIFQVSLLSLVSQGIALTSLHDSRCTKRNCSRQIQDYISLENHKNYDLDGNELIDKDAQRNTCVKCNRFLTQYEPVYLHFSKRPALEEGATASPSSFDEALDETKGACALPLYEDKSDHVIF
jgi:hypothetical protein